MFFLPDAGPTGFQYAPVSKAIVMSSTLGSAVQWYTHGKVVPSGPAFVSPVMSFLQRQLVVQEARQIVICLGLLYNCRLIERRMGSPKFASFLAFVSALSVAGRLAAKQFAPSIQYSGPLGLVFACFAPHFLEVPSIAPLKIGGISLNENLVLGLIGSQVMFFGGIGTIVQCAIGFGAGLLYQANPFNVQSFLIPKPIRAFFANTIGRLIGADNSPLVHISDRLRAASIGGGGVMAAQAAVQPSEENVAQLVAMGFSEDRARNALASTADNLENALTLLLA